MTDAANAVADIVSLARYRAQRDRKAVTDPIVAHWRCRMICINTVGVTQLAYDVLDIFNRELRRRRESELDVDKIVLCDEHAEQWRRHAQERGR